MDTANIQILDFPYPVDSLLSLFKEERHVFFFHSSQYEKHQGRFSFLGFDPFDVWRGDGFSDLNGLKRKFCAYQNFLPESRRCSFASGQKMAPFSSGIAGFLGYPQGIPRKNSAIRPAESLIPENAFFGFYERVLAYDHKRSQLIVFSSGLPEQVPRLQKAAACAKASYVIGKIRAAEEKGFFRDYQKNRGLLKYLDPGFNIDLLPLQDVSCLSNFTKQEYLHAVQKALAYICKGDIYQVNLSQRFQMTCPDDELHPSFIYQLLSQLSPSAFSGYQDCGAYQIISSSPERFMVLRGEQVQTRPMKGTRPRGIDPVEDKAFLYDLIVSPKEKAELLMITDLLRNDLGRVCKYGSVKVKELRHIEQYTTVWQATATVQGELHHDKDAFDLLAACFPGGSITGCPKIRAMQIIDELEPADRSVYTGSLGYVDFSGDMDFSILIRSLLKIRENLYFQVGGGIVYDSDPEKEYEETLLKASAIQRCLRLLFQRRAEHSSVGGAR